MTQFTLQVLFPPPVDADVEKREFTYSVNNGVPVIQTFGKEVPSVQFIAPRDATIHMNLVDIDVAGNRSEASERDFTVVDTIPPAKPGELGVTVTAQNEEA